MISEKRKQELVEKSRRTTTLEGVPCMIAGWRNDYATITADCGGVFHASWDNVERVITKNFGQFTADDVCFDSWWWMGIGVDVPARLMAIIPYGHR